MTLLAMEPYMLGASGSVRVEVSKATGCSPEHTEWSEERMCEYVEEDGDPLELRELTVC